MYLGLDSICATQVREGQLCQTRGANAEVKKAVGLEVLDNEGLGDEGAKSLPNSKHSQAVFIGDLAGGGPTKMIFQNTAHAMWCFTVQSEE